MVMAALSLPGPDIEAGQRPGDDTLASLVGEVADILADPGVTEEMIGRALARGLVRVAAATRLPELAAEARFSLEPGRVDVALPADWQHGPTDAAAASGRLPLRVLPSPAALRRAFPGDGRGCPRAMAVGGGRLLLRPVPAASTELVVGYFRLPRAMAASWDKPEGLPPHLAGTLLVAFACRELFERLEEGAAGDKVQTAAYGRRFEAALAELVGLYGPALVQEAPVDIPGPACGEVWL